MSFKITFSQSRLYLILFLSFFLYSCGWSSSSTGTTDSQSDPADTTAPSVSSTLPANAATVVARNSNITASFDEDMFASTVDVNSFTLTNSAAGNIDGNVGFDGVSNIATFAPSGELALLASYTATLTTAITDLSGNALVADYSWSFTTADGTWGTPSLIESDNAGNASMQQLAFDNNGNAIAIWSQNDGTRWNVWTNRFDGSSWATSELLEVDNVGDAVDPQIAFDNSGNAIAVWAQDDGLRRNIWANHFDGSSWGTPEMIETDDTGPADLPQIAFDDNGNAIAVWMQMDSARWSIWANRFDGASWGGAALVETIDTGEARDPQIAFDKNGKAIVVWAQNDGTRSNIRASLFSSGSWGGSTLIESDDAGDAEEPQIAFDNAGNALAIWQQFDGVRYNVWTNRFDGSSWGTASLIENDDSGFAGGAQIAIDGNGNAIAVWSQHDGTRLNAWANHYDGSGWTGAVLIEADDSADASNTQITFDSNGNALAIWYQDTGIRSDVWVNRFDGVSWGGASLIESDDTGSAGNPQIAVDNNGNAFAIWDQSDGTRYNILVNRFE